MDLPYGSAPESPGLRILRWLSGSFRIGRFFGVELRCYGLALVLVPLFARDGLGGFWGLALLSTIWLYLTVYVHEMGHVLAGRRYGISTRQITLSPLGGLAHMTAAPPGPRAEAIVALAGPATHLAWLAIVWPLSLLLDSRMHFWEGGVTGTIAFSLETLRYMNLALLLFNLLPVFPLDGGRVFRAFLAARMNANRASIIAARIGIVGAVGFVVWGTTQTAFRGGILFAIALGNVFVCLGEIKASRYRTSPYAEGDRYEPWQEDPEAWKQGAPEGRERRKYRGKTPEDMAAEREALDQELDRVLARVSEVGLSGLTKDERKTLQRASEARRKS